MLQVCPQHSRVLLIAPAPSLSSFCAVTNHTRKALRLRAELEHASECSVHLLPFDLPFTAFTVEALSTFVLPVVFVPLQAASAAARLVLRRGSAGSDDDDGVDDGSANGDESIVIGVTGKGCRGLLSLSRSCHAQASGPDGGSAGEQRISVKSRVGVPLPFVVSQCGSGSVLPCNGFIPAYGSVTLVARGVQGDARGCAASVCVVRELLERSFKSTLLA